MNTMPISKFKSVCLAEIDKVRKSGQPLRITRFGKPVADIVPIPTPPTATRPLGCMEGTIEFLGDVMVDSSELEPWEVMAD
jgi:antitoxin (DNA-binding transcriptional repressor) of toxin-antitoxin stability system